MGVSSNLKRAVFLDRDGIINEVIRINNKPYPPDSLSTFRLISGVSEKLKQLRDAGYLLFVITNQPDVARGKTPRHIIEEIHKFISEEILLEEIFCCYHDDKDDCTCRKPRPGFFLEAEKKWGVDLSNSFMVGDRWKDIEAAENARVNSIFVDYNYDEPKPISQQFTTGSPLEALTYILNQTKSKNETSKQA